MTAREQASVCRRRPSRACAARAALAVGVAARRAADAHAVLCWFLVRFFLSFTATPAGRVMGDNHTNQGTSRVPRVHPTPPGGVPWAPPAESRSAKPSKASLRAARSRAKPACNGGRQRTLREPLLYLVERRRREAQCCPVQVDSSPGGSASSLSRPKTPTAFWSWENARAGVRAAARGGNHAAKYFRASLAAARFSGLLFLWSSDPAAI